MMKKKFVIGLLVATLGIGAVSLPSCKDNTDDLSTEMKGENATLKKALEDLKKVVDACPDKCSQKIAEALKDYYTKNQTYSQTEVDQLLTKYAQATELEKLSEQLDKLLNGETGNGVVNLTKDQVESLTELANKFSKTEDIEALSQLAGDVTNLAKLAAKADKLLELLNATTPEPVDLTEINEALWGKDGKSGLVANVVTLEQRLGAVEDYFKDAEGNVYTVERFRELLTAGQWVIDNKTAIDTVLNNLKDDAGKINEDALKSLMTWYGSFEKLNSAVDMLFPDGFEGFEMISYPMLLQTVNANYQLIMGVQEQINAMLENIGNMVTSLVLHSAWNPCFGGFNTPFGISSNMLMTFYGKADTDINFPAQAMEDAGINGNPFGQVMGGANETVGGWIHQASLGTLYFTANPVAANVDINGFSFENSRMEKAPVELAVKPSDKLLTMGFSRAYSGNGFYEVTATLPENNQEAGVALQNIKVRVEDGLLQAAKDAFNNRTLGSVASLAAKLYNQLKDVCPAYALRYDWANNGNDYFAASENAVLSQYGVAVTAAKPLSFTTLRGSSFESPFPHVNPIEISKDLVDLNIKPFEVGDVTLDLKIEGISWDNTQQLEIKVKIPAKFDVDPNDPTKAVLPDDWQNLDGYWQEITVPTDQIDELIKNMQQTVTDWIEGKGEPGDPDYQESINQQIENALNEVLYGKGNPGDADYKEGLITSIEGQVNDMIGSIQDKLDNLVDEINGEKYLGRLNSLIERYNSWNDRLSHILSQPNHYMQVAMFYNLPDGGAGMVSNTEGSYTPFKWNGGEGFNLWATTFNFETVAPCYKKFVAVTKIEKDGVDITSPELLAKANSASSMATVLDGNQKAVTVTTKGVVEKGHVYAYEITYRGVDFHGKTSTARYYFTIDAK